MSVMEPSGRGPGAGGDSASLLRDLEALEARRSDIERRMRDAVARMRYGPDVERARAEEAALVRELDLVMTRIRAAEARLLLLQKG